MQDPAESSRGTYLENVTVENCGTGISVENSAVRGKNVTLRGNSTGLRTVDSRVEIDGLKIE